MAADGGSDRLDYKVSDFALRAVLTKPVLKEQPRVLQALLIELFVDREAAVVVHQLGE